MVTEENSKPLPITPIQQPCRGQPWLARQQNNLPKCRRTYLVLPTLELDAGAGFDAGIESVLDLDHLGDGIGVVVWFRIIMG